MSNRVCVKCGTSYEEGEAFCTTCGQKLIQDKALFRSETPAEQAPVESDQLIVMTGFPRFLAWIIDLIICGIIVEVIRGMAYGEWLWSDIETSEDIFFSFGPWSLLLFAYWFIMEWRWGQSIGKMALGMEVVNQETGENLINDPIKVALSSFGKAFLLIFDVILGWILSSRWEEESGVDLGQRFFQRLSGTVVVKKIVESAGMPPSARFRAE